MKLQPQTRRYVARGLRDQLGTQIAGKYYLGIHHWGEFDEKLGDKLRMQLTRIRFPGAR